MPTKPPVIAESPLMEVRNSPLHGLGVFATQDIKKGTRIVEYIGERISHAEADRRYEDKDDNDNHTFLFSVDEKIVIDAGVEGNDARYFNHCCDPNCESVIEDRRVFIEAIRDIAAGDEMTYDYQIGRERSDPPNIDEIYACKCGAKDCRGTMLWPPKRPGRAKARKKAAAAKSGAGASAKNGAGVQAKSKRGASTKSSKSKGAAAAKGGARTKAGASRKGGARAKAGAGEKGGAQTNARAKAGTRAKAPARAKGKAPAKGGRAGTQARSSGSARSRR